MQNRDFDSQRDSVNELLQAVTHVRRFSLRLLSRPTNLLESGKALELYFRTMTLLLLGSDDEKRLFLQILERDNHKTDSGAVLSSMFAQDSELKSLFLSSEAAKGLTEYYFVVANFWSKLAGSVSTGDRIFVEQLNKLLLQPQVPLAEALLARNSVLSKISQRNAYRHHWFAKDIGLSEPELKTLQQHFVHAKLYWGLVWRLYARITKAMRDQEPPCSTFNDFLAQYARAANPVLVAWSSDSKPNMGAHPIVVTPLLRERLLIRDQFDVLLLVDQYASSQVDEQKQLASQYVKQSAEVVNQLLEELAPYLLQEFAEVTRGLEPLFGRDLQISWEIANEIRWHLPSEYQRRFVLPRWPSLVDTEAKELWPRLLDAIKDASKDLSVPNRADQQAVATAIIGCARRLYTCTRWHIPRNQGSKEHIVRPLKYTLMMIRPLVEFYSLWGGNCFGSFLHLLPGERSETANILSICSGAIPSNAEAAALGILANELFLSPVIHSLMQPPPMSINMFQVLPKSFQKWRDDKRFKELFHMHPGRLHEHKISESTVSECLNTEVLCWTEQGSTEVRVRDLVEFRKLGSFEEGWRSQHGCHCAKYQTEETATLMSDMKGKISSLATPDVVKCQNYQKVFCSFFWAVHISAEVWYDQPSVAAACNHLVNMGFREVGDARKQMNDKTVWYPMKPLFESLGQSQKGESIPGLISLLSDAQKDRGFTATFELVQANEHDERCFHSNTRLDRVLVLKWHTQQMFVGLEWNPNVLGHPGDMTDALMWLRHLQIIHSIGYAGSEGQNVWSWRPDSERYDKESWCSQTEGSFVQIRLPIYPRRRV